MSPSPLSSTPILRTTLITAGAGAVLLAVLAGVLGGLYRGAPGLISGLIGVLIAVLFLAITAISILIANRWFGDPLYVQLFFAIVLGGWFFKLVLFVVLMIVLRGAPWLEPVVFFWSLLAGVLMSLVIDVVVLTRMRLPHVSDSTLPTVAPEDVAPATGGVAGASDASVERPDADSGNSHV